jgi:hypothetical protein
MPITLDEIFIDLFRTDTFVIEPTVEMPNAVRIIDFAAEMGHGLDLAFAELLRSVPAIEEQTGDIFRARICAAIRVRETELARSFRKTAHWVGRMTPVQSCGVRCGS